MLQTIARGYSKLLSSVIKVAVLLVACAALGSAIVFPLWKFATSAPVAYTVTMLGVIVAVLAVFVAKRVQAIGFLPALTVFLRIVVVVGGLAACVALVLHGKRLFAIPVAVAVIILYGVLSFGRDKK